MKVAICVATYRRPQALQGMLSSLDNLRFQDEPPDLEIVIVDNSPSGETASRSDEFMSSWPTRWVHEPRPGIPFARNAGVGAALPEADWIAFIDDDERADQDWLAEHLRHRHLGDVLTGPVMSELPSTAPSWLETGGFFDPPRYETGTTLPTCATGNAFVASHLFSDMPTWFDGTLADTGGSDTDFFLRAAGRGHTIVWVDTALVIERVPLSRASRRWLVARWFRRGTIEALLIRRHGRLGKVGPSERLIKSVGHIAVGFVRTLVGVFVGPSTVTYGLTEIAHGAGSLWGLAGGRFREYRRDARRH